jgi:uncharacterized protein YgiM (DUF1202 family)
MKRFFLLFLGVLVVAGSFEVSAATNASVAKKPVQKPIIDEPHSTPLVAGPASVVATNVNVRGRAGLIGEVLTKIHRGDKVMVVEEITLKNSKADEPSAWAKINLPDGAHVWVHTSFIDTANKTVKPKKLNLRGGPGENYSVIGTLEKGAAIKELQTKGDWIEIEAPTGAYAFVAAQYLSQEAATPVATPVTPTPTTPEPTPEPAVVPAATPVVTTPTDTPPATNAAPLPTLPVITPTPDPVISDEPPPQRIVQHEGIVKGAWSIQSPTKFALVSADTGKTINYLYTTSTNLDLRRYKGLRIVVTGEEGLDKRWRNTPVITIRRIQVIE